MGKLNSEDISPVKGQIVISLLTRDSISTSNPLAIVGPTGDVQIPNDDDMNMNVSNNTNSKKWNATAMGTATNNENFNGFLNCDLANSNNLSDNLNNNSNNENHNDSNNNNHSDVSEILNISDLAISEAANGAASTSNNPKSPECSNVVLSEMTVRNSMSPNTSKNLAEGFTSPSVHNKAFQPNDHRTPLTSPTRPENKKTVTPSQSGSSKNEGESRGSASEASHQSRSPNSSGASADQIERAERSQQEQGKRIRVDFYENSILIQNFLHPTANRSRRSPRSANSRIAQRQSRHLPNLVSAGGRPMNVKPAVDLPVGYGELSQVFPFNLELNCKILLFRNENNSARSSVFLSYTNWCVNLARPENS